MTHAVPLDQALRASALPSLRPAAPTLPAGLIPAPLRAWIMDIAERAQIPPEFVAVPALVALASVIGRSVAILPKRHDDWRVVPNLWGAIVGRPSSFKSPAISAATAPLRRLAAHAQEEHATASVQAEADTMMLKARKDDLQVQLKSALKKGAHTTALEADLRGLLVTEAALKKLATEHRYIVNDPTVEKLGELLIDNPRGLLLIRDELSGWLRSLDKQGREGDREFYLEAWNGTGGYTVDRIGRGTLHVPSLTLSVMGGIQPSKLAPLVASAIAGGGGDDGLLQRLQLLVWPDRPGEWRNIDRVPDRDAAARAMTIFETLDTFDLATLGIEMLDGEIPALRFSDEAQATFDAWRDELEMKVRSPEMENTPAFESHLSKYRSLMPSLALIFHLVDAVERGAHGPVSADAARLAIDWCAFLEAHARKIYAAELNRALHTAYALKERIDTGEIADGDSVRSIYQHHWSGIDTPETVLPALAKLEQHNIARIERQATGGRPTDVIRLLGRPD